MEIRYDHNGLDYVMIMNNLNLDIGWIYISSFKRVDNVSMRYHTQLL
jgi:hypothetical protein